MPCYSSLICYPSVCTLMSVLAAEWNRRCFGGDAGFGFFFACVWGQSGPVESCVMTTSSMRSLCNPDSPLTGQARCLRKQRGRQNPNWKSLSGFDKLKRKSFKKKFSRYCWRENESCFLRLSPSHAAIWPQICNNCKTAKKFFLETNSLSLF